MSKVAKTACVVAAGALTLAALPGAQAALAHEGAVPTLGGVGLNPVNAPTGNVVEEMRHILLDNVEGVFSWDQGVNVDNETLARTLYEGSRYLCEGQGVEGAGAVDENGTVTQIAVKGAVAHAFMADVAEYNEKAPIKRVLGCTCKGNPADGRASANAEVAGFMLRALVEDAAPVEGVNAITFTSADGYAVTLPYNYVMQRFSIIVSQVNGEDAAEAIGCSNQLWLGSIAARAFVRDVVSIEFSVLDEEPAVPSTPKNVNQPNIGVQEGVAH